MTRQKEIDGRPAYNTRFNGEGRGYVEVQTVPKTFDSNIFSLMGLEYSEKIRQATQRSSAIL